MKMSCNLEGTKERGMSTLKAKNNNMKEGKPWALLRGNTRRIYSDKEERRLKKPQVKWREVKEEVGREFFVS